MPPEKHALLSASASKRWMHCPPSARLTEFLDDQTSVFAMEGTDAHALCEHKVLSALGLPTEDPVENLSFYNSEMEECAEGYASYIMEIVEESRQNGNEPLVLIEQRIDYSRYVPEGFGTGDCLIVAGDTLYIVDYKHGKGVPVDADRNPQMMLYALGALELVGILYDIQSVCMTIYQPRLQNISVYEMSKDDLLSWAENELVPAAKLAWEGDGDFHSGEWCRFCKARETCRERADANMALAEYEFRQPPLLSDDEVEVLLDKADALLSWVNDLKEYAYGEAMKGKRWQNFKLVEGRSIRKYTDEAAVAQVARNAGFTDIYKQSLLPITEMEKLMGKQAFRELLGDFVTKPQGKPTLVHRDDKRPEISTFSDFMEVDNHE